MATSAAQSYIARLGFQDPDRRQDRHGLACEYLFERMIELEVVPRTLKWKIDDLAADIAYCAEEIQKYQRQHPHTFSDWYTKEIRTRKEKLQALQEKQAAFDGDTYIASQLSQIKAGECINVPIVSDSYRSSYVNGFADVLIHAPYAGRFLGEVKITKEPAEQVLQQINFYLSYLQQRNEIRCVYVVTDYDPGDLKRLCAGTKIKVYRLGNIFENWLAARTTPATEEL